ncbi:MAG: hypothetical protein SGI88_09775 [Candidatus Hydrogenedentes bacterium]|nr:hypothetical protein [Candidatus Hydrogenedentota bacterium]
MRPKLFKLVQAVCAASLVTLGVFVLPGCPTDTPTACECLPTAYNPVIDPENFVKNIDNPYFPLAPGTVMTYEAQTPEGTEEIVVRVLKKKKTVLGVTCTVVRDTVKLEGEVIEDTYDWYAQDKDGNVWYMGEASMEFENDMVVSTFGSWEGGVDCAKPGIIMRATPKIGESYRQEYYPCVAEDKAKVVSQTETVTVIYDTFDDCIETEETTPLDPDVLEMKFYAPGIGHILTLDDGERAEELISITTE